MLKMKMSAETLLIIVLLATVRETTAKDEPISSPEIWSNTEISSGEYKLAENNRSRRLAGSTEEHVDSSMNYHELIAKMDSVKQAQQKLQDDFRERRESDGKKMDKIGAVKSSERHSAIRSETPSESWSKQPLSIEFRHRTNLEDTPRMVPEDSVEPSSYHSHQLPRIDFITSNRRFYSGEREGRDLSAPRQMYEDYDMHPVFRSYNGRGRDYQIPISRAMYLNRYKGDRDYYRVPMDMRMKIPPASPYYYNRYRLDLESDEQYLDSYGRLRPTNPTKPKRIIYYATLPEIVRKPVDIRNYPRFAAGPYTPPPRVVNVDRNGMRMRPGNVIDPTRRPYVYPVIYKYSNLDGWSKRPSQYEQISKVPFNNDNKEERRDQERGASGNNSFQGSDTGNESNKQLNLSRIRNDEQRNPWSLPAVASETNVKENEQRNSFGRGEGYDDRNRYQSSRNKEVVIDQEMSDT